VFFRGFSHARPIITFVGDQKNIRVDMGEQERMSMDDGRIVKKAIASVTVALPLMDVLIRR
jgi:hypothetical protein